MAANFTSGVTYGVKSWHGDERNLAADDPRRFSAKESLEASELTLWSAYNGVTEWTSHYRQKDRDARKASVWFGASAATNSKALDLALSIAG